MQSPDDLNDTDISVLKLLAEGRETRGSLADRISKHENYVGERLRWLRAYELVSWYHEPTALYEITDKGRQWLSKALSR